MFSAIARRACPSTSAPGPYVWKNELFLSLLLSHRISRIVIWGVWGVLGRRMLPAYRCPNPQLLPTGCASSLALEAEHAHRSHHRGLRITPSTSTEPMPFKKNRLPFGVLFFRFSLSFARTQLARYRWFCVEVTPLSLLVGVLIHSDRRFLSLYCFLSLLSLSAMLIGS